MLHKYRPSPILPVDPTDYSFSAPWPLRPRPEAQAPSYSVSDADLEFKSSLTHPSQVVSAHLGVKLGKALSFVDGG